MTIRKLAVTGLVVLGGLAGALLLPVAPALAGSGYGLTGSFGGAGSAPGQFTEPSGAAVNDMTHDVYVADSGNDRVQEFNSTGTKVLAEFNGSAAPAGVFSSPGGPSGIAVDNSGKAALEDPSVGDVYVVDRGHKVIDKFSESNVYLGQLTGTCENPGEKPMEGCPGSTSKEVIPFGELEGVAVSADGTVWVSQDNGMPSGEVDSFSDATAGQFLARVLPEDCCGSVQPGLAVDAEHNIYAAIQGNQPGEFSETGSVLSYAVNGQTGATGMAIDPASNDVFIGTSSEVEQYGATGSFIARFGSGRLTGPSGLAVAGLGTVYVVDLASDRVDEFNEGPTPEAPLTEAASEVQATTAKLNGTLKNPEKEVLEYHFIYGTGGVCTGGGTTETKTLTPEAAEKAEVPVSIGATGLEPNAQYDVCLVATNRFGGTEGLGEEVKTRGAAPAIEGLSASGVGAFTATLEANVNPENQETSVVFEYATEESLLLEGKGTKVPAANSLPPAGEYQAVGERVYGLEPATKYYLRVAAMNATGTSYTPPTAFTTLAVPLVEETEPEASEVTQRTALIGHITINPEMEEPPEEPREEATYYILYGETEAYGQALPEPIHASAGYGLTGKEVAPVQLYGLTPGTTYHYAIVAHNANGTQTSRDHQFTTAPAEPLTTPPTVGSETVQFVNESGAVIQGDVNPQGLETTYMVQYGTSTAYGSSTPGPTALSAFTSAQGTITALTGLAPGTTYHYRLVTTNGAGTSYGQDETFRTAGAARTTAFTSFAIPTVPLIAATPASFPAEAPVAKNTPKKLTKKQKLAAALKTCKKSKSRRKRSNCEKQAHRKYGAKTSITTHKTKH